MEKKYDVIFAELNKPLFLGSPKGGRNCGEKLDGKKVPGLKMVYDRQEKELTVTLEGHFPAIIPKEGMAFWWPDPNMAPVQNEGKRSQLSSAPSAEQPPRKPGRPPAKVEAQVGGPQHHVFQGPGHGQTGVSLNVPK